MTEPLTEPHPETATWAPWTLSVALVGSVMLWLAQPPVAWGWLGWVAPAPWLIVACRAGRMAKTQYLQLWLAGAVYWLLAAHWLRLPHPLYTPFGWVCLGAYLGCYLPVFVWLTRLGTRQLKVPLWIVAPVVWTGLELLQAHLFTGFLMGALSHTQARYTALIQIADTLGAYGVSFVMMLSISAVVSWGEQLVATASGNPLADDRPTRFTRAARNQQRVLGAAVAVGCLILVVLHGRQPPFRVADARPPLMVALIQGNAEANVWDAELDFNARNREIMDRQTSLSLQAAEESRAAGKPIELFVWPESMFRPRVLTFNGSPSPPTEASPTIQRTHAVTQQWFHQLASTLGAPLLMGADRFDLAGAAEDSPWKLYNSSVLIDRDGRHTATYDKTHRVPFGEYIPLAKGLPALYFMTPMEGGLQPGAGPVAMRVSRAAGRAAGHPPADEPITVSPNICYETVIPHVIRRQVAELTEAGNPPDLLANLTNDAWFWGTSELDMHLACDIYRAIETRTPMVVAANGGLSAVIDARGRVIALSQRQKEQALIAAAPLRSPGPASRYVRYGDWFAGACLLACGGLAILGVIPQRAGRARQDE